MKAFGLALGGGGVKGLAHIALLKQLDEMGAKPAAISGTSMGAIIGALYAHGLSGIEIEERVRAHLFSHKEGIKATYRRRKHLVKWLKVFKFDKERGGFITADGLFEHLFSELLNCDFSELEIPFTAVAADFHTAEEVTLNSGQVLPAVQASMAVPGVFAPAILNDRLLVDGGVVNNVPCSHIAHPERLTIASDVISLSEVQNPKATEVVSGAFSIMMRAATEQRFAQHPPDFVFRPDTKKIEAFDFHKIAKILARGDTAITTASTQLEKILH